jgi:hypothetical protein
MPALDSVLEMMESGSSELVALEPPCEAVSD